MEKLLQRSLRKGCRRRIRYEIYKPLQRLLSLMLCAVMVLGMVPVQALTAEATTPVTEAPATQAPSCSWKLPACP